MLVKTEAIIIKSMKYRDTSKIVTFYTKEYGKTKGIAKGARTAKNKFGSALEPLSHSMLVFYKKEHHDLHLISQCDAIESFKHLTEDLDRMSAALAVIELVNQVTHHEEGNPALFMLIVETLSILNSCQNKYQIILQAFQMRLASLFGYAPDFESCNECKKPIKIDNGEKQFSTQIARGAIFCNQCLKPSGNLYGDVNQNSIFETISAQGLQIMRKLLHSQLSSLNLLECDTRIGNEVDELIRLYLRYHFDGVKTYNSTNYFH